MFMFRDIEKAAYNIVIVIIKIEGRQIRKKKGGGGML
jgi:hypothetical protein